SEAIDYEHNLQNEVDLNTGEERVVKVHKEEDLDKLSEDEDLADWEEYDPTKELSSYRYPTPELMIEHNSDTNRTYNESELNENARKIVEVLKEFKIDVPIVKSTVGPRITLFEIKPAAGIKISKIRNLEDEIAMKLAAEGIRIIAPLPGRGTIGIEIPNQTPEVVSFKSVIRSVKFRDSDKALPIAIGKTISNEVQIEDLSKMPHLLVAGATGQGKSVGLNAIIASILYKKHPSQVKFVLIDPKQVEFSLYQVLENHFLAQLPEQEEPVITDVETAVMVLNSLVHEMEERYALLKAAMVRNIKEYNEKFVNRRLNPQKGHRYLPYIVVVLDEFGDLMMMAGNPKEVETPITRLAQKARAIGIHLIIATQRPSVNVITGIIKANFPARIAYTVQSAVDSKVILDTKGAEKLIGMGDMLLSAGMDTIRLQTPFIDTEEVDKLVHFIGDQKGYDSPYILPEPPMEDGDEPGMVDLDDRDALFEDAARLTVRTQQGSTSFLQRRLKIGYSRAARISEELEIAGIVGPNKGSKGRDVLIPTLDELERYLSTL
ncbi:MAG: DNA translocase FtsK, partial [Bacteroidota bacterium]